VKKNFELKKLWKVECGDLPLKIVIEDPTGNSGIISEKTKIEKLKVKK
jgi:C4-type Zn-finger protein